MKNPLYIFLAIIGMLLCACGEKLTEEVITKYYTGEPKKVHYFTYKGNDKVLKKVAKFSLNGVKEQEGEMKDEVKNGLWSYWYAENGQHWIEENYDNGLLHGNTTVWYKSGEKQYEGNYKQGKPHGEWIYYNDEGDEIRTENYEDGVLLKPE